MIPIGNYVGVVTASKTLTRWVGGPTTLYGQPKSKLVVTNCDLTLRGLGLCLEFELSIRKGVRDDLAIVTLMCPWINMICDSYGRKTLCPSDSSLHCFIPALTLPGSAVKDCGKVLRFRSYSHHRVTASISSQKVSKSRDYVKVLYIVDLLASRIISISF